jgi:hypothetical protein
MEFPGRIGLLLHVDVELFEHRLVILVNRFTRIQQIARELLVLLKLLFLEALHVLDPDIHFFQLIKEFKSHLLNAIRVNLLRLLALSRHHANVNEFLDLFVYRLKLAHIHKVFLGEPYCRLLDFFKFTLHRGDLVEDRPNHVIYDFPNVRIIQKLAELLHSVQIFVFAEFLLLPTCYLFHTNHDFVRHPKLLDVHFKLLRLIDGVLLDLPAVVLNVRE